MPCGGDHIVFIVWLAVTKQSFKYRDDTRKSLENGVLLCELLNGLRPGTIKRINRLPTPLAGLVRKTVSTLIIIVILFSLSLLSIQY
ncbi:LIM and calponin homology domains-containing protein 1-like [Plakobranchus ocellatus]|uniref:LIM and calponin homology domains-containing protein 1-like n=1 Tax=Plakobranchus ocellatus TaxID=259542 RepID=A0AAV3Z0G7_9GAST|nr:LIM and calponin homology domains-containing protein 1-like [Plakobranchus ocellatus]